MAETINGLRILVTGATDGIGRALADELAGRGARLVVHGRDPAKVAAVVEALRGEGDPGDVSGVVADLASLRQVARLAGEIRERFPDLDVLVNNAGAGAGPKGSAPRDLSADGFELRLAVNYLAPVLLTRTLAARGLPRRAVVNVGSAGQEPIDFDDPMFERGFDGLAAYRRSKLALAAFSLDFAEEHASSRPFIACNVLHPGSLLDTKIVHETFGASLGPVRTGVTSITRVIEASLAGETGRYFDETRPARAKEQAYDRGARARLRALTDAWLAPFEAPPPAAA